MSQRRRNNRNTLGGNSVGGGPQGFNIDWSKYGGVRTPGNNQRPSNLGNIGGGGGGGGNNRNRGGGGGGRGGGGGGGGGSGSGGGSSSGSGGGNVNVDLPNLRNVDIYNPVDMPELQNIDPEMARLNTLFGGVEEAYDTTDWVKAYSDAQNFNQVVGTQSADNAARSAAAGAAQSGGQVGSSVLRAQLLLPMMAKNAELGIEGQRVKAEGKRGALGAGAELATTMANLKNSYINTLASYNSAQAQNRIAGNELRFNTIQGENQNRMGLADLDLRGQIANADQWQFNQQMQYQNRALNQQEQLANADRNQQQQQWEYQNQLQTTGGGPAQTYSGGAAQSTASGRPNIGLYNTDSWNGAAAANNAAQNASLQTQYPYANFYPLATGGAR